MEQHSSHWMDFYEILLWGLSLKSVEKVKISQKLDKNIRHFM